MDDIDVHCSSVIIESQDQVRRARSNRYEKRNIGAQLLYLLTKSLLGSFSSILTT